MKANLEFRPNCWLTVEAPSMHPKKNFADVHLEPLLPAHAQAMFHWMCDADVRENVGVRREPSLAATEAWLQMALGDDRFAPFAIVQHRRHVGNVILDRID